MPQQQFTLECFQAEIPNFGDDLNAWLWPQLFPGAFAAGAVDRFIGIGSILDGRYQSAPGRTIVFGTGARGAASVPRLDRSWDVRFVRGPRTAAAMGLPMSTAVGDGALALKLVRPANAPRCRGGVGIMPHFRSMGSLDWQRVADLAGLVLIDPRGRPDVVVDQIAGLEGLLAEAMHGAIVADLYRTPWVRVTCISRLREGPTADFKWYDWAEALGADATPLHVAPPPAVMRRTLRLAMRVALPVSEMRIARQLAAAAEAAPFRLSPVHRLDAAVRTIEAHVDRLRAELGYGEPAAATVAAAEA